MINNCFFKTYNADSYSFIYQLKEQNIKPNHIITDPPYNISKKNNFSTMKNPRKGIDFGNWDQGSFNLVSWIPLYTDILDENGSMIIFCSFRFLSYLVDELESSESGMLVKDVFIWQKTNPMPRNIRRRYVQDMEFGIWAVKKNSKWTFNKPNEKSYLRGFFSAPVVSGKERTIHPTQKSLKIMQDLISIHTNPGDIILDPFMGSGTTGVAALKLNRNFIGIEKEKVYFDLANNRLQVIQ